MKRTNIRRAALSLLLAGTLLCSGCTDAAAPAPVPTATAIPEAASAWQRFNRTDLSAFDTVITLVGFAPDQAAFDRAADRAFWAA